MLDMKGIVRKVTPSALAISLVMFNVSALAASQCKGMNQKACGWIDSYKTKTGKTVAAYCRAKPAKSKAAVEKVKSKEMTKEKVKEKAKAKEKN